MVKFRKFKNVKSTHSDSQFNSIGEAFDFIRGNRPDLDKIQQLRQMQKGTKEFQKLKETLPCIMWNFDTNGGRKSDSVVESTGYLYYDIDYMDESELNINTDYVYARWKSVSETGFGLLIKVAGVNLQNFKYIQQEIGKNLNIPFDNGAKDAVRLNILSYDPNIWINEDAETLDYTDFIIEEKESETKNSQPINQNSLIKSGELPDGFSPLRFNNLEDKKAEIEIVFDENGVCDLKNDKLLYTEVYVPFKNKIALGKRHYTLSTICIRVICLNPNAPQKQILSFMRYLNKTLCEIPKDDKDIQDLVKKTYANKSNLILQSNKTKRFFFENKRLPLSEKQSLVISYINKWNSQKRRNEICNCIEEMEKEGEKFRLTHIKNKCKSSLKTINDILKQMPLSQLPQNLINRQKFLKSTEGLLCDTNAV